MVSLTDGSTPRPNLQLQPGFPDFLSAEAMLMASITALVASAICHARIVCCSNLVFTADWEMNSCGVKGQARSHIYLTTEKCLTGHFLYLKGSLKKLKLPQSVVKSFSQSAPCRRKQRYTEGNQPPEWLNGILKSLKSLILTTGGRLTHDITHDLSAYWLRF